jgi:hypothetical protein
MRYRSLLKRIFIIHNMKSFETVSDAMDYMTDEIEDYTPEDLAWKLLTDDVLAPATAEILTTDIEGENHTTYLFEILLTMYVEMLVHNAKLLHLINKSESGDLITLEDFKLKFDDITIHLLTQPFREKLLKIRYFLRIDVINSLGTNYYCKILFRDLPSNKIFFQSHQHITKKYHFILNASFKSTPHMKLENMYAVSSINGINYKVSFQKVVVHHDDAPEKIIL